MDEAEHGFAIVGMTPIAALRDAACENPPPSADRAAERLAAFDDWGLPWLASSPEAGGQAGALRSLRLSFDKGLPIFMDAAHDSCAAGRARPSIARASPAVRLSLARAMDEDPGSVLDAAYERAERHGPAGSRRTFARNVGGTLYDPARLRAATEILGRLANDPVPAVGDAALEELYLFVEDRLGTGGYDGGDIERDDVPWDGLSPATLAALRRGVGRRLRGPLALKAAVVLARLHDRRPTQPWRAAFGLPSNASAMVALGALGDRRATPLLLAHLDIEWGDAAAYDALRRMRDPAAIPALLELVRTGSDAASVPALAAGTIAAIGDRSAAPRLVALASPSRTNLYVALGRLGGPEATAFLLDRLMHDSENLVQHATLALGERSDPADVRALRRFAESGSPRAMYARQALGSITY